MSESRQTDWRYRLLMSLLAAFVLFGAAAAILILLVNPS
jgi:hypothetical protein